jgi:hypothetical protein
MAETFNTEDFGLVRLKDSARSVPLLMSYERDANGGEIQAERRLRPATRLKYSHHMLARLVAQGTSTAEISAISGRSPRYIEHMTRSDPAFKELVSYYSGLVEDQYIDVHARLAHKLEAIGMATLDELWGRLEEHPELMSVRELKELFEVVADRGLAPVKGARAQAGGGISVNVNFVPSQAGPRPAPGASTSSDAGPVTIDITPENAE